MANHSIDTLPLHGMAVVSGVEQEGQGHFKQISHLTRIGKVAGLRAHQRHYRRDIARRPRHIDRQTPQHLNIRGASPTSSWASRSAVASADTSCGSRLPPGKATRPECVDSFAERTVSSTVGCSRSTDGHKHGGIRRLQW